MGYLVDYLVGLGMDAGKDVIVGKKAQANIKQELRGYIEKQSKINEFSLIAEEIDFQGWAEYLTEDFVEDVKMRLFGNKRQRTVAREEIVKKAIVKSNAHNEENKKRVAKLIGGAVDILRHYYESSLGHGDLLLAGRVEDTVSGEIQSSKNEIITEIQKNYPFSVDHQIEMVRNGDIKGVEKNINLIMNAISGEHPLFPDYRFVYNNDHILSRAVSEAAQKKHPPRFLCKAEIKVGDRYVETLSPEITEYANRHQLRITIDIQEAQKLLGDIPDPIQTEAEQIVGTQAIIEPLPFPSAFPCSLKMNDQVEYEYVELRTEEILDNGVFVISNREQKNIHMRMTMYVNMADKTVSFKMKTENANNHDLLQYVRFMKKAMDGEKLTVHVLSLGVDMVQGDMGNCDYKGGFESIDEELRFLEGIVAIEDYFHTKVEIPEEIYENDMGLIQYLRSLIDGEECTANWTGINFGMKMNEQLRERKKLFDVRASNIAFVGLIDIHLYGEVYSMEIIRRYECAKLENPDKIRKLLEILDDGDHIDIKYVPATADGKSQFVDRLKTDADVIEAEEIVEYEREDSF